MEHLPSLYVACNYHIDHQSTDYMRFYMLVVYTFTAYSNDYAYRLVLLRFFFLVKCNIPRLSWKSYRYWQPNFECKYSSILSWLAILLHATASVIVWCIHYVFVVVANADNIRFQTSTTIVIVQLNIWCSYSFNVNLKCYHIENFVCLNCVYASKI